MLVLQRILWAMDLMINIVGLLAVEDNGVLCIFIYRQRASKCQGTDGVPCSSEGLLFEPGYWLFNPHPRQRR